MKLRAWLVKPESLFLVLALFYGIIFLALTPPLAGGDEKNHYQRLASIAYGQILNKDVAVPEGIERFIETGESFFLRLLLTREEGELWQVKTQLAIPGYQGSTAPFNGYRWPEFHELADIRLHGDHAGILHANYITVHNPVTYLPQLLLFKAGALLNFSPLTLLYLARLGGLAAGIALGYAAIRVIPTHRYTLCALLLLPPVSYYRSHINADILTNGFAFLFTALVMREIRATGPMTARCKWMLCCLLFLIGQCKYVYLALALLLLAIPATRFKSSSDRWRTLLLTPLPGLVASLGWMLLLKYTYFSGLAYRFDNLVSPDLQMAFIMHHPGHYLSILSGHIFGTIFFIHAALDVIGDLGWCMYLPFYAFPVFACLFFITAASDGDSGDAPYPTLTRWLTPVIFSLSTLCTLTLLYLQWNKVGSDHIAGFQGRYLYPVLPTILFYLRPASTKLRYFPALGVFLLAAIGIVMTSYRAIQFYYGV